MYVGQFFLGDEWNDPSELQVENFTSDIVLTNVTFRWLYDKNSESWESVFPEAKTGNVDCQEAFITFDRLAGQAPGEDTLVCDDAIHEIDIIPGAIEEIESHPSLGDKIVESVEYKARNTGYCCQEYSCGNSWDCPGECVDMDGDNIITYDGDKYISINEGDPKTFTGMTAWCKWDFIVKAYRNFAGLRFRLTLGVIGKISGRAPCCIL